MNGPVHIDDPSQGRIDRCNTSLSRLDILLEFVDRSEQS
jgi:hypothetical protein